MAAIAAGLNPATAFHEAFDSELADAFDRGAQQEDFRAAGKRATKSNPNPTGEDAAWWRVEGPKMVQAWVNWRRKSKWRVWTTPDRKPAIELGVVTEIAGMPLKMVIDRVMVIPQAEALCIVDLKTGSRTPESDLQLGVYRLGLYREYGVWANHGGYWMARKGELSEIVPLERFDEAMLNNWFDALRRGIENEVFIPHITNMCRACGHRDYCAAYGGTKSHLDPDSPNYKEEE